MDDAFGVRGIKSVSDIDANFKQAVNFHGSGGDDVLEGCALHELHHDEGAAIMFLNVVDGADIGVIQRRGGPRFTLETLQHLSVFGNIVRQEFQRDEASQAHVFGLVDHAHTAAAEFLDNPIMRDGLSDERIGAWHVEHILGCDQEQVNEDTNPRGLLLRFLSSSRPGSCKCFDKSVDITCVVVRGERDPNTSATYTAHNIMTTKTFYNCLYVFARVSQ